MMRCRQRRRAAIYLCTGGRRGGGNSDQPGQDRPSAQLPHCSRSHARLLLAIIAANEALGPLAAKSLSIPELDTQMETRIGALCTIQLGWRLASRGSFALSIGGCRLRHSPA